VDRYIRIVANDSQLVTFEIAGRSFGLPVEHVVEVIRMVAITPVPAAEPWVAGVIDVRGQTVPMLDLHARFGGSPEPYGLATPIVIAGHGSRLLGVIVDAVTGILAVSDVAIDLAPGDAESSVPILGWARKEGGFLSILDLEWLLQQADPMALSPQP
jgi:purine-binding chemotaxis protein CheW